MAKVAGAGTGKQGPNRLETDWSAKDVPRMAAEIERISGTWADRSHAVKVLRALCDLAAKNPDRLDPNRDTEEWGFLAMDIGAALRDRGFKGLSAQGWATDPDNAKSRMNEHWPKLKELWGRQQPTLVDGLNAAGIALRPHLGRREGGGSGKNTKYGFQFDAPTEEPGEVQPSDVDLLKVPQVSYRQQDISGNRLVRWMSDRGFYLGGWGGRIFAGTILILLIAAVLWSWLILIAMGATPTTVGFLKLGLIGVLTPFILYAFLGWQIRLVANRVALAPLPLQPLGQDDYLLELRKDEGATRNTLYLVRYVANCPLCGSKGLDSIHIASGRLEFHGRLVGRCSRAPNAHVFSFDHVSKQGRFLR